VHGGLDLRRAVGAGKSTLSTQLAQAPSTVLIREDAWLAALYPAEIRSIADYPHRAALLRSVLAPHLQALLRAGVSVVLDFPFNALARPATRHSSRSPVTSLRQRRKRGSGWSAMPPTAWCRQIRYDRSHQSSSA